MIDARGSSRTIIRPSSLSFVNRYPTGGLKHQNPACIRAVIFGLVDYSTIPVTASLVATHIGRGVMGLAFGLISAGHQVGAALGTYFGGVLYDLYAQYEWVWWSPCGSRCLPEFWCS